MKKNIFIGIAILLLIAGGGVYWYLNQDRPSPSQPIGDGGSPASAQAGIQAQTNKPVSSTGTLYYGSVPVGVETKSAPVKNSDDLP